MEDDVPLDKEDCLVVLDEDGQEAGVDSQAEQGTDRVKHLRLTGSQPGAGSDREKTDI